MSESAVFRNFRFQTSFASRAARMWQQSNLHKESSEAWKIPHAEAMQAREVEDLINLCGLLANCGDLAWKSAKKDIFRLGNIDFQGYGKRLEVLFNVSLKVYSLVEECIAAVRQMGYEIDNLHIFIDSRHNLQRTKAAFMEFWPWIDEEMMIESERQYAAGNYRVLSDIIDDLQGGRS